VHIISSNLNFFQIIDIIIVDIEDVSWELANVASKLIPPKYFSPDRFFVAFIFRPYVPNIITNWRVLNEDVDIINFISLEGTYENDIIDEKSYDIEINKSSPDDKIKSENIVPKYVVKLEDLYDLKYIIKKSTNCKTHSSTMNVQLINLGIEQNHQNVNLGLGCSRFEITTFIRVLKQYKDLFSGSYNDPIFFYT
jgi:hypothetical protein